MITVGLIGAGKMGISHLAILGAHPDVEVVGVSDSSKIVLDVLRKYSSFPCFTDYREMIEGANPDAVFVAVPTRLHTEVVKQVLLRGKHVFSEKPLCLTAEEGRYLVELADKRGVVNQVGYHNRFVGSFREAKRLVEEGCLGEIFHFSGEAYGAVVVRSKQESWRSDPAQGGGCLMDYASHVIDLINYILGPITNARGAVLKSLYSKNVEDLVCSILEVSSGVSGLLTVNWSDETYRKMSTSISILGSKGKIICDANEIKVFFKKPNVAVGYTAGWNVKYLTDLNGTVDFYLRGEEYSAQVDYFIKAVQHKVPNTINDFRSAWETDKVISMIKNYKH